VQLIATKRSAWDKADQLRYLRDDGTECGNPMPRQGILPHDLVHYVVESILGLSNGFLSLVAAGADSNLVMELAHRPDAREVQRQATQAEAVVEALQTQLWNGALDVAAFLYGIEAASAARNVEPHPIPDPARATRLYAAALDLQRRWESLPALGSLVLEYRPGTASRPARTRRWHALALGDALTAQVPMAQIEQAVKGRLAAAELPAGAGAFVRHDSEGRLHCEVTVYFTPALVELALEFGARPTSRPPREGLTLLAGEEGAWNASA